MVPASRTRAAAAAVSNTAVAAAVSDVHVQAAAGDDPAYADLFIRMHGISPYSIVPHMQ